MSKCWVAASWSAEETGSVCNIDKEQNGGLLKLCTDNFSIIKGATDAIPCLRMKWLTKAGDAHDMQPDTRLWAEVMAKGTWDDSWGWAVHGRRSFVCSWRRGCAVTSCYVLSYYTARALSPSWKWSLPTWGPVPFLVLLFVLEWFSLQMEQAE